MNVNAARWSMVALPLVLLATGCAGEPADPGDIPGREPTGTLQVLLGSDSAVDIDPRVEEVWVRVEAVQVRHEDNGWVEVAESRQDIDLMAAPSVIGEARIWEGGYESTQIAIADAWIIVDGVEEELGFIGDVDPLDPFGAGLVENETFFLGEDQTTALRIHWNLDDNLEPRSDGWFLGAETTADVEIGGVDVDPDPE